jgi:sugar lactone lactonase YvrE
MNHGTNEERVEYRSFRPMDTANLTGVMTRPFCNMAQQSPRMETMHRISRSVRRTGLLLLFVPLTGVMQQTPRWVVDTVPTGTLLNAPDGAVLDANGNLLFANFGQGKGTNVVRMTPSGEGSIVVTDLSAPDALAFDHAGNLFISNFGNGTIVKVAPNGDKSVFASGLDHPSGLAFDRDDNLYVSNFGNFNGTTLSRVTPSGTVSTFAQGFAAPLGLVFDAAGTLYVSNFGSGVIHKVSPKGELSVFASIPNATPAYLQYLVFDDAGTLYVPSYGHNRIYRITRNGVVSSFAGTGTAGGANGVADSAQFDGPNSIVRTADGIFFVTDINASRLRRIRIVPAR